MSKVKLYKVLHVERFMNLIEECKGRVLWHLCGDTAVDLHRDGLAMDVIRKEAVRKFWLPQRIKEMTGTLRKRLCKE